MAIQYPSYQIPQMPMSPGAFTTGLQSGLSALQGIQQAKNRPQQMQMQQQMQQAQLQSLQNKNQVQPQMLQAQLAQQQAQAPLTEEQTKRIQAQINQMPMDQAIKAQMALNQIKSTQQSRSRFSTPAYQLNKALATTAGKSLYATNKQFAAAADRVFANTASQGDEQLIASQLGVPLPTQGQGQAGGQQAGDLVPAFQQGFGIQRSPQQAPADLSQVSEDQRNKLSNITDQDVSTGQSTQRSQLIKQTSTPQTQNQRMYHQTLDGMIKRMDPYIDSVAKFSGLAGRGKLETARLASIAGHPSKDYTNYKLYQQQVVTAGNDIRRMLGENATDAQIHEMQKYLSFGGLDVPPELVHKKWDTFKGTSRDIGAALGKTSDETESRLRKLQGGSKLSNLSGSGAPVSMPSDIKNDDQFNEWFSSLSPEQRAEYHSAHKAKGGK